MFDSYNRIFDEKVSIDDINHYAAGLKPKEDEKRYKVFELMRNKNKVLEFQRDMVRDYKAFGKELWQKIWKEDVSSNGKKILFLGARIWQAHQQIVQPFLPKLLTE